MFKNRLAARDTGWSSWYAPVALIALLIGMMSSLVFGMIPMGAAGPFLKPTLATVLVGVLPIVALMMLAKKRPTNFELGIDMSNWLRHSLVAAACVAGFALFINILGKLMPSLGGEAGGDSGFGVGFGMDIALLLGGIVIAPLFEELAYRVAILRPLHDGLRNWSTGSKAVLRVVISVAVAALMFTLPHAMPGQSKFIPYVLIAVFFCLIYVFSGSLVCVIMAHAFQSAYAWGSLVLAANKVGAPTPLLLGLCVAGPIIVLGGLWVMSRIFGSSRD